MLTFNVLLFCTSCQTTPVVQNEKPVVHISTTLHLESTTVMEEFRVTENGWEAIVQKSDGQVIHISSAWNTLSPEAIEELGFNWDTDSEETKLNSNQLIDPTVKTPVESGNVQGTAGHE